MEDFQSSVLNLWTFSPEWFSSTAHATLIDRAPSLTMMGQGIQALSI